MNDPRYAPRRIRDLCIGETRGFADFGASWSHWTVTRVSNRKYTVNGYGKSTSYCRGSLATIHAQILDHITPRPVTIIQFSLFADIPPRVVTLAVGELAA